MNLTIAAIERVSRNLIAISTEAIKLAGMTPAGLTPLFEGAPSSYYRRNKEFAFYALGGINPANFTPQDNVALNKLCEAEEGHHNKAVKRLISASLAAHFKKQSFHLNEFGPGFYPILSYFNESVRLSYHGIDTDEACLDELHRMDIPASDWNVAMQGPAPDKPVVAAGVYSLHFLAKDDFGQKIEQLTSAGDGFFVGNFYIDPSEEVNRTGRKALAHVLEENNLYHVVLKNPKERGSEYWIIGKMDSIDAIDRFATTMQQTIARNWSRKLEKITAAP